MLRLLTAANGTFRKFRNVRATSVIEGTSDVRCSLSGARSRPVCAPRHAPLNVCAVGCTTQLEDFYYVAKKATHRGLEPAANHADHARWSGWRQSPTSGPGSGSSPLLRAYRGRANFTPPLFNGWSAPRRASGRQPRPVHQIEPHGASPLLAGPPVYT